MYSNRVIRKLVSLSNYDISEYRGVTHKKTIIEYCEAKIKKAEYIEDVDDPASYILLYELMVMLIRQNGVLSRFLDNFLHRITPMLNFL